MNGVYDSLPEPGKYIVSTIAPPATAGRRTHARQGRGGRGDRTFDGGDPDDGFLATYDPDELVGRERGNNYMKMLGNKRQPLYNRAVRAKYPPGSTFKLVQGLIGLQEGVLRLRICMSATRDTRRGDGV